MSDTPPNMKKLPHLSEDLIWKIMVKADPKTVGQCRTLSKGWNFRLCTNLFVKANYKENKDRSKSVIVGIGYPPGDYNSIWFVRAYLHSGRQVQFNVPMDANQYGLYSVIGSENGIICIKISLGGLNSRLLVWNPVSDKRRYVTDEASKHSAHAVSLYAFGFLEDEIEYRIVHVYKRAFRQRNMSWSLYTSFEREWTHSGNDIITVMECRDGSGSANDAVRTDFLISRLKYMESRREHLVQRTWQEHVNVKTITMHSDGLYMV
ncbi:uncharacterized protein [Arachis hypogaea]|uniref:uncharacterized protein n=1 Tax=Arachis hypogaea TaxID=3818 RepID=UPI003B222828